MPSAITSVSLTDSSGLNNGLDVEDDGATDVGVASERADCVASECAVPVAGGDRSKSNTPT